MRTASVQKRLPHGKHEIKILMGLRYADLINHIARRDLIPSDTTWLLRKWTAQFASLIFIMQRH